MKKNSKLGEKNFILKVRGKKFFILKVRGKNFRKNFQKKKFRKKKFPKFKFKVKVKVKGQVQGQPETGSSTGSSKKEKRQILCLFFYDVINTDQMGSTYYSHGHSYFVVFSKKAKFQSTTEGLGTVLFKVSNKLSIAL